MYSGKITFREIYTLYRFDIGKVAEQAGVDRTVVSQLVMEQGSVSRQDAEKVLAAVAKQTGRNYTMNTVKFKSRITSVNMQKRYKPILKFQIR